MKENWKNKRLILIPFYTWRRLAGSLLLPLLLLLSSCGQSQEHQHAEGKIYTCPMHPEVVQDKPGTCPICKMDLVKRETANKQANQQHSHDHEAAVYTCPMHPDVKQDKPGSCPVCGMDLVKQGGVGNTDSVATELGDLLKPVNTSVVSSIATVHPESGTKTITVELPGTVEYDTRRINAVSARFAGRIEKLYLRYNFQRVTKGQKLLEVYSPQLVEAQQELIFLLSNDAANTPLIEAAKQKLSLLGLSAGQINQVVANRKPQYKVAVYSPYNGYVVENTPNQNTGATPASSAPTAAGVGSGGMGGMNTNAVTPAAPTTSVAPAGSTLSVTEGAYVTAGQPIFRVVNTDRVWAVFQVYAANAGKIQKGQAIQITPENTTAQPLRGTVELVEPFFRNGVNTATLRIPLANPDGQLRTGMVLTGQMEVAIKDAVWLPSEAVLDLGNQQVAFIKKGTHLQPVAIQVGVQNKDWVQVLNGLTPKDGVAQNAQYLLDNEAFVRINAR